MLRLTLFLLMTLVARAAYPQASIGSFSPAAPTSVDRVRLDYRVSTGGGPPTIEAVTVAVADHNVDVQVSVTSQDFSVSGTTAAHVDIGPLPAGSYTVRLLVAYRQFNGPYTPPYLEDTQPLVIVGAPPQPIPVSRGAILMLAVLTAMIACARLRGSMR